MKLLRLAFINLALANLFCFSPVAYSGDYIGKLSYCALYSISEADNEILVRWLVVSTALHPLANPKTSVTEKDIEDASQDFGRVATRIITKECVSPARDALKYEGEVALDFVVDLLVDRAQKLLFGAPKVKHAWDVLGNHTNNEKKKNIQILKENN